MKVYTAGKVADFFRARANPEVGDVLSNLKLQKLCYYAAGIIAAVRRNDDTPLFREPIERGSTDRSYQSNTVGLGNLRRGQSQVFQTLTLGFSTRDADVLDDVYNFYGQYSAWKLRNMTHEEPPWMNAYARENKVITIGELRDYFSTEVGDAYIESYRAKEGQPEAI